MVCIKTDTKNLIEKLKKKKIQSKNKKSAFEVLNYMHIGILQANFDIIYLTVPQGVKKVV